MDPSRALVEINGRDGTAWELRGRLAGGYQEGATELAGASGERAVLKIARARWDAARMASTKRLLDRGREAGWPSPRWLSSGTLASGEAFTITEWVDGEPLRFLTDDIASRLLDVIERQAGIAGLAPTDQTWSAYTVASLSGTEARQVSTFSARGAELAALGFEIADGAHCTALRADDLVHGDFSFDNILFDGDGVAGLIDAQAAGGGSRAIDLANLLIQATLWGGDATAMSRVVDAGSVVDGSQAFLLCVTARALSLVSFGTWNWPQDVDEVASRLRDVILGLR